MPRSVTSEVWSPPKLALVRYRKVKGAYRFQKEFSISKRDQALTLHDAIGEWSTVSTVTGWEPERLFEWTVGLGDESGATDVWRFELTPDGEGTALRQWARMGPGPSGLTQAIERWPDKEERIVEGRLREWRTGMERNLDAVRERLG